MELNKFWQGIQEGDEKSLEGLFREVNSRLCCYAEFLLDDQVIAQEVVQDVFLKIWQDRERILIKGSLKSYLYKAVKNKVINVLIQSKTKKASVNKLLSGESWQVIQDNVECNEFIIEKIEARETSEKIMDTVNKLPEQCRKIFIMSRFENKSNKEIAIRLKISEHTVKAHIYKALESIKKIFE
jgi:RNA polymerase sigma-70 factor, ECF subfamily